MVTGVSPQIFGLQHCCRFRKRILLSMGGLRLNTLFLYPLSIICIFSSFSFSSISLHSAVYISGFIFSPSAYIDPYWLVLLSQISISFHVPLGLSWFHKFQLHFMSLMPQIKGTFIKIEHFKMNPCQSQNKMTRVRGSSIT